MRIVRGIVILFAGSSSFLSSQSKAPPTPADYGQWEDLVTGQSRGGLSPDGRWLAYGINRSNRNNELRIASLAGGKEKVVAFGSDAAFSADSHWLAYSIGLGETQEEKLRKDKKPVHKKLGLFNGATGDQTVIEGVESFAFSPNGAFLAIRRYGPEKKA